MSRPCFTIGSRKVGIEYPPLVVADIGINHEGDMAKAKRMIDDAHAIGAECIKFQCHIVEDEMISAAKKIVPGHAKESIWEIMERCSFSEEQERELKNYVENLGMIYLNTPFSRAAADRLERMGVLAYKIGSGECNNYPLVRHIASFGKPVILSTGMNNIESIRPSVEIMEEYQVPYVLLHCVSMYPTPYNKVRLGSIDELRRFFPNAIVGLSDHSVGNYTCLGAVALGACVLEKHFTSDKNWPGPDIMVSINPRELKELIIGSKAIHEALDGKKEILADEQDVINFAYACVVTIKQIKKGEMFTMENIWVKRPGTGNIKAKYFEKIIGKISKVDIETGVQLDWEHIHLSQL